MNNLYPGVESGVLFIFYNSSSAVYADIPGFRLDCLIKFNANVHCLIRRQNKCIGKYLYLLKSPAMKWFFQVWIDLSTAFILCNPGGTIWNFNTRFRLYFFMKLDA